MKLGITPWDLSRGQRASALASQAVFSERAGFDSFWVPEHHFTTGAIPDPLMLLAAVAGSTEKITLGTTSYLLPIRHPIQAAEQVAVMDQLCNGRLILGVGRGFDKGMLNAFDCDPATKRSRFERTLDAMYSAWRGEPVFSTDEGRALILEPLPVQQPHPPIWIAAFGPLALAQAGRLGLPYLASPVESLSTLESNYAAYRDAAIKADTTIADEIPVMRSIFVTDNRQTASDILTGIAELAKKRGRRELAEAPEQCCIIGDEIYVRDRIVEYRERIGMTKLILTGLFLERINGEEHQNSATHTAEIVRNLS